MQRLIDRTGDLVPLALAALVASCTGQPAPPGPRDETEPPGGPLVFFEESCCEDDLACQDGNWCNGIETCDCWGECGPGEPPCLHDLGDRCLAYGSPACQIDRLDPAGEGYGMGHCQIVDICDCTVNADCDDGLWCNGAELCVSHRCAFAADRCTGSCETCNELTDSCDAILGGPCSVAGDCCGDPGDCIVWTCVDGSCVAEPVVCDDGLVCTADVCNPLDDTCSSTLTPGWCLIAGVCYADGTRNPVVTCEVCDSVADPTAWTPVAAPPNDLCGGIITIPVGSSLDGDTRCASPDYVDAGPCGRRASANDVTYDFDFTTGTDYQLYHYRVSEVGSGVAPHPDPHVYARSTCTDGSAAAEWRCNDDCWNGFSGTNYATGCGADPALSGVVVINPVPVGFSQNTSVIADGEAATRGTITTAVTREPHDNNDCRGSSAYHAAPDMFPGAQPAAAQDVTWRGNNVGYGNLAGVAPSCGGTVDHEAVWRVSTPVTPPVHFYYDELALLYDGNGATNPFDGVLQLLGPDASIGSCSDAANFGCSWYPGLGPASIVLGTYGVQRDGWLALGSSGGREGQYELTAMTARVQFTGQHEWFPTLRPASSGGANFDLECTRLDFAPDGSATTAYAVAMTPTGCGWAVDPSGDPGRVVIETLVLPGNMDDCSVNYPIGFQFLWGDQFYSRMIVDTNGRIQFVNDSAVCASVCNWTCADSGASVSDLYTVDNPMLAAFWADLIACEAWVSSACSGRMGRITRQVAPVAAPTGEVITATVVSWEDFGYWAESGGDVDFQVILYIDGRFSIVYRRITGTATQAWTNQGLVGISGQVGAMGTAVNFR